MDGSSSSPTEMFDIDGLLVRDALLSMLIFVGSYVRYFSEQRLKISAEMWNAAKQNDACVR